MIEDRLSRLESEVKGLARSVERLEARLEALEASSRLQEPGAGSFPSAAEGTAGPVPASEVLTGVTLFGRTLLVLGGGYLLRAITESGALAPLGGVALGLAYALLWMLMADRAGAADNALNAAFHGAGAVLVAFPLLWETTVRFELLSPVASALCLALVSFAAIAVSWRWQLRFFAWVTLVGSTFTSFALIVGTRALPPFTLFLIAIAVATYWISEHGHWQILPWVVSLLADIAVAMMTFGALIVGSGVSGPLATAVPFALFVAFLSSFAFRMYRQHLSPRPFELVQTGLVVAVGYGGSLLVSSRTDAGIVLAALGILLALLSYRSSVSGSMLPATGRPYLEGTAAGLLLLGSLAALPNPTALLALSGVGLTWLGMRFERTVLSLEGSLFLLATGVSSGMLKQGGYAFVAPSDYAWPNIELWWLVAFVATGAAYAMPAPAVERNWWERWRIAKLVLLGLLVWAIGGAVLAAVVPLVAGTPGVDASAAVLASVRTAVLALSSLVLAALARFDRFREASWLVFPVLVAGGIKLVIEDFMQGEAATLFVALALYGGAVFVAPRLARGKR